MELVLCEGGFIHTLQQIIKECLFCEEVHCGHLGWSGEGVKKNVSCFLGLRETPENKLQTRNCGFIIMPSADHIKILPPLVLT